MSRSAMVPKTSNQGRLFRILPLAAVAVVLVLIGGPGKLAELPPLARWGLFACMVFAFFEPMLPGSCFGGQFVLAPQTLALNRYARTFWKVLLILYICCFVAEMKGEVRSFEVFLNGKSVVSSDHSPNAQATVAVQTNNKIKLILTGEPSSKVFVLIAYDPRQSE